MAFTDITIKVLCISCLQENNISPKITPGINNVNVELSAGAPYELHLSSNSSTDGAIFNVTARIKEIYVRMTDIMNVSGISNHLENKTISMGCDRHAYKKTIGVAVEIGNDFL